MRRVNQVSVFCLVGAFCLGIATRAEAHFPWLTLDDGGRALYFFGENIADRAYHLPESLAATKVYRLDADGNKQAVELAAVETDAFVGRRSHKAVAGRGQLYATAVYGNYHGMKLSYSTQLVLGSDSAKWPAKPTGKTALEAVLTESNDGGVAARIFWQGKPLAGARVRLFCAEGHEEGTATTNEQGIARFAAGEVEVGLNGLLVGHVDKEAKGKMSGVPYTGAAHYLTITFLH
jgi:hypothetical protein